MIMLPLHGQDTAAVEQCVTGQAVPLIFVMLEVMFLVNRRGLFCRVPFACFSLSFMHSCVGLTVLINKDLVGVLFY